MENEYFTGRKVVFIRKKISLSDLIKNIQQGLQPYRAPNIMLPPPDAEEALALINPLSEEINKLEKKYPGIQNMSLHEWRLINTNRQVDAHGRLIPLNLPLWVSSTIMENYWEKCAHRDRLQEKINKYHSYPSWIGYEFPKRYNDKWKAIKLFLGALYKQEDILELEAIQEQETLEEKESDMNHIEDEPRELVGSTSTTTTRPLSIAKYVNFFIKEGDFWKIGYDGETKILRGLDGIHYIALLLEKQSVSISCRDLYHAVSGIQLANVMSEGAAINEGLNVDRIVQYVGLTETRKICSDKYDELKEKLPNAGIEEQEKIKEEMKALLPYLNLKERNFADPNDRKAQANIKKRLDKAYKTIREAGLKKLAQHLKENIRTDGAFGLRYSGILVWEITIK